MTEVTFSKTDYRKIKDKVLKEFFASKAGTAGKRSQFINRHWLYQSVAEDEKVKVNMIRGICNSLLSLYYQDKLQVKWTSRDLYHFIEAKNFQSVCEYDYDNLDMEIKDYQNQKNRFLKGVGIRVLTGWDDDNKNPTYKVVDPLSWYPDPRGHTHISNFRFMGFESTMDVDTIKHKQKEGIWRKIDVSAGLTPEMKELVDEKGQPRQITDTPLCMETQAVIYTHYTMYNGMPIQVVMLRREGILDVRPVEPLMNGDKLDKVDIRFPVALNYYEPLEGDPRGINLYDIVEDKQKLKTLLYNLIRIQAIKQALGGRVFLDRSIYTRSKSLLGQGVMGPQYIPVDGNGQNIGNMLFIEPERGLSADVYNFPAMLDNVADSDTGISKLTRGVGGDASTATEVEAEQANTNINLVLGNKINAWGEKTFWQLWYSFYKYYFSNSDEKYVTLNRGICPAGDIFSRKNLIGGNDPRIQILNKGDLDSQNRADLNKFTQVYAMVMADQGTSAVEKRFMKRKYFALLGMSENEIEQACRYTPAELEAKEQVELLNHNIPVEIGDMNEDHYTYLTIYQSALNTPATKAAIEARRMAYIQSGQQAADMAMQGMQNQGVFNGVTNNMIQNQNTKPFHLN